MDQACDIAVVVKCEYVAVVLITYRLRKRCGSCVLLVFVEILAILVNDILDPINTQLEAASALCFPREIGTVTSTTES